MSGERREKIRFLKSYKWLLIEIASSEDRAEEERERLYDVRVPMLSDMPRGGRPVTMDERVVRVVSREAEIQRQKSEAEEIKTAIEKAIGQMLNPRDRTILKLKYLQGCSFEEIACRINYSVTHTKRLHDEAIDNFVLPDMTKRNESGLSVSGPM